MRPILVDTNAYTAFKSGNDDIVDIFSHAEEIILSTIVLGELYAGFAHGKKVERNRKELTEFMSSSRVSVAHVTQDTANYYATVYAGLRKKGKPIPTNDLWIAAQALENGYVVCTLDKHFLGVAGLLVAHSLSEIL